MSQAADERKSLLGVPQEEDGARTRNYSAVSGRGSVIYKVYGERWWILTLYTILSIVQAILWNTWGPISDSAEKAYNLTNADIALLENWNNITYIAAVAPFIWLLQRYGLRTTMLMTAALMFAGAASRCFLFWHSSWKILINIGQILSGIAGPIAFFACTPISATWFPPEHRVFATSVMSMAQPIGIAISFVLNWSLAATCWICLPVVLLYKPIFHRTRVDTMCHDVLPHLEDGAIINENEYGEPEVVEPEVVA